MSSSCEHGNEPSGSTKEGKFPVLWYVAPCSLVEIIRRFRGAYCLHLQVLMVQRSRRQSSSYSLLWEPEISPGNLLTSLTTVRFTKITLIHRFVSVKVTSFCVASFLTPLTRFGTKCIEQFLRISSTVPASFNLSVLRAPYSWHCCKKIIWNVLWCPWIRLLHIDYCCFN
jgi:hypothetical protein